jgi:hypothetical protein
VKMLLAIAALGWGLYLQPAGTLIQPQLAPQLSLSAERAALVLPTDTGSSSSAGNSENSLTTATTIVAGSEKPAVVFDSAVLPDAPVAAPAVNSPAPIAFLKPGKPSTVTIDRLREENRRNLRLWKGLVIASHGAATFDAWSTRHAITTSGAQELNPLLRPFAGNASLYAAIQVAPFLMDFAGRKMMYSRNSFLRHTWWIPQSASFVSSLFCGAHNLSVH